MRVREEYLGPVLAPAASGHGYLEANPYSLHLASCQATGLVGREELQPQAGATQRLDDAHVRCGIFV